MPCTHAENIRYTAKDVFLSGIGDKFYMTVDIPQSFKVIKQIKAIGVETIGTIGGYLGLFCGKMF